MREQAAVIHVALTARYHRGKQLVDKPRDREIQPQPFSRCQGVFKILHLKLRWTARLKMALHHALPVLTKNAAGSKPAL